MKKLYILILTLFSLSFAFGQVTIWEEDFDSYANGTGIDGTGNIGDYPGSVSKWTLDISNGNFYGVTSDYLKTSHSFNSQVMTARDVDGDVIWLSENIDISGYTDVALYADFRESGSMESSDFYRIEYKIDAGSWTTYAINGYQNDDYGGWDTAEQNGLLGTTLNIRITVNCNSSSEYQYFDNIIVKGIAATPTITVTPTALNTFEYAEGSGSSAEQTYTVSGSNLTNDIDVTPPTNWEIATTSGGPYQTTAITLTQTGGTVASTSLYTRMVSGLLATNSPYSGNITHTSSGVTQVDLTVDGSVYVPCSQLIISEYGEILNGNYLEIYNPTNIDVDLSNYQIWRAYNGGAWNGADIISLSGTIVSGDNFVVARDITQVPSADLFDTHMNYNGNDNIGLAFNDGSGTFNLIDAVGDDQGDPGIGWAVAGTSDATLDHSLVRKPTIDKPNTNWSESAGIGVSDSEWIVLTYSQDAIGYHVSNCKQIPIMRVTGNNELIENGDITPQTNDNTMYPDTFVVGTGISHTFQIWNVGNTNLNLTGSPAVEILGTNASDFTVTTQPGSPVTSNGGHEDFVITFNPTDYGLRTALVSIANDNPFQNPYTFVIQGKGINYIPCSVTNSQLLFEDFEDATVSYTTSVLEFTDNNYDYFIRTDGSNIGANVQFTNLQGTSYFTAQDTDGDGEPTILNLAFNSIDITDVGNLDFSVFLAEDDDGATNQDWDANTALHITYRIDGGTWENLLWVEATNGTNSEPAIDNDFDGVGDLGSEITDAFQEIHRTISGTGSTLDIDIEFRYLDAGDEDIAIDNIKLTGDIISSTTWNGTAWSNGAPTPNTKAIFDADYNTSTANIDACACQVNAGSTLTVGASNHILIETDITNNGIIEVEHEGSLVQHKDNAIIDGAGTYKINKTTPSYAYYDYTYWSSPLTNETIGSVFNANPTGRIYNFVTPNFSDEFSGAYPQTTGSADSFDDDNDDWQATSNATILTPGTGYIAMGAGSPFPLSNPLATGSTTQSVVFDGGTLNNGIVTVNVSLDKYNTDNGSGNADNTNLNLIGNPYASAIDITKLRTDANNSLFEGTFYFWTHDDPIGSGTNAGPDTYNFSNDDYSVVTVDANGVFSATASSNQVGSGAITANQYVASGQGFFANVTGNGTIEFNNNMRVTNQNNHFLRPANNNVDRLWLNLRNQNHTIFRQILVGFYDGATDGFFHGQDGQRMANGHNTDFYSLIPNHYGRFAIQNLGTFNDTKNIDLGLEIIEDGMYEISIDHSEGVFTNGQEVYIKDRSDNSYHEITNGIYQFNASIGDNINNRFTLVFRNTALSVDNHSVATNLIISQKGNFFNLNTTDQTKINSVTIYNMLGQELGNYQSANDYLQISSNKYSVGSVLIIKTILENGSTISKKVIKL